MRRLDDEIGEFAFQQDQLTDALSVADQTAGPHGRQMTVDERIRDMLDRHGPDSPNIRAHPRRGPYLRSAARRVAFRLEAAGIAPADTTSSDRRLRTAIPSGCLRTFISPRGSWLI